MKFRFILNPRSGHVRRCPDLPARLQRWLEAQKLVASLVLTERPQQASELARQAVAEGCDRVVAVGGDGTVNEVAQALVATPAALGIVPLGSGNGLARDLGLPLRLEAALARSVTGNVRVIDVGYTNGRAFFCATGTGFDAEVVQRFNKSRRRGLAVYLALAAQMWWRAQPEHFVVECEGRRHEFTALFVAVANAAQLGNNARIAPGALLDDGRLDLVAVPSARFWHAVPLVWRLFAGTLDRAPAVRGERAAQFVLERATPGPWHVDGEIAGVATRLEISVRARALRVVA